MRKNKKTAIFKNIIFLLIVIFFYTQNPYEINASGSYGWFSSKVEYIDSSLPSSCDPNIHASIEFQLVESGTKDIILNSIGSWSVNIRRASDNIKISGQDLNGEKQSNRLCFDPINHGLQVIVFTSSNYRELKAPTIIPNTNNQATLESMRGNHFRGYLELESQTVTTPTVEGLSPNGGMFSTVPNFFIRTNSSNSTYTGAHELRATRIYIINQSTNQVYATSTPTTGGVGVREFNGSELFPENSVPDGIYYWTFHQEMNGENLTQKLTPPAREWIFSSIPATGAPDPMSFVLDTTPPNTVIENIVVTNKNDTLGTATISLQNTMFDAYAGLAHTIVYAENTSTGDIYEASQSYAGQNSRTFTVSFPNLSLGQEYRFYARTSDALGNEGLSENVYYIVATEFTPPQVILHNSSNYTDGVYYANETSHRNHYLAGRVVDNTTNPLPIISAHICWSIDIADLENTYSIDSSKCFNRSHESIYSVDGTLFFNRYFNNLPASTTIYFLARASNEVGWGYSPIGSFNTPVNPFDWDDGTETIPTVSFLNAGWSFRGPFYLRPGLRIESAGGRPITHYGICIFADETMRNTFDPSDQDMITSWSPDCQQRLNLSLSTMLPFTFRYSFDNLTPETNYYFIVYATNEVGTAIATGTSHTIEYYYDFSNSGLSIISNESDFNIETGLYDRIAVDVTSHDFSTPPWTPPRIIDFQVSLDENNDGTYDRMVQSDISIQRGGSPGTPKRVYFYDVPPGVIRVRSVVNMPPSLIYQPEKFISGRIRTSNPYTLPIPSSFLDNLSSTDDSSSSEIATNPEIELSTTHNFVRWGSDTHLNWSMKQVNVNCSLSGPSSFDTIFINPTINGTYDPITDRVYDSATTSPLYSSQIFRLQCQDPASNVYSATTRINMIGNITER